MKTLSWALLLALSACSTLTTSTKKMNNPNFDRSTVFPIGVYRHNVELTINGSSPSESKNFHFLGLVKLQKDQIETLAISPFGLTLFKILDNLKTGEIKSEIYIEQIKKHEARLLEYYGVLKGLLLLKASQSGEIAAEVASPQDPETKFSFLKIDDHHIPEQIKITGKHFIVDILVAGYEI